MLKYSRIGTIFFFAFLFISCRKDFERPNWDVDLLAPLIRTTLTLDNILPDSITQTNTDTSLKLVYQTSIFDLAVDSIFTIPNVSISDTFNPPLGIIVQPGQSLTSEDREEQIAVDNGIELNYVLIESGFFEIEMFSEIQEKLIIKFVVPSATKDGDTLIVEHVGEAAMPGKPAVYTAKIDLSGYELDLTGVNQDKVNTFISRITAIVDTNGSQVVVTSQEEMILTGKLIDLTPSFARGGFGNQQIQLGPAIINLNLFNRVSGGTLDIEQLEVALSIDNGIGVDAEITISQFDAIRSSSNETASLNHAIINSPLTINRAQQTFSVPEVTYSNSTTSITTLNSNIDQLVEIFPNQLMYAIDVNVNPLGNVSGHNDFIFKDHALKMDLNVEFPLSIIANNLTLADTINFALNTDNLDQEIITGDLILFAENGYPLDATIALDLLDANNNLIVQLSSLDKINAGLLNSSLKVESKTSSKVTYALSAKEIDNLYTAKKIAVQIAFTNTNTSQFIKIFGDYTIDIRLVGDFVYHLNLE